MKKKSICAVLLAATMLTSAFTTACKDKAAASGTSDSGINMSIDPNVTGAGTGTGETTKLMVPMSFEENYDNNAIKEMGKIVNIHGTQFTAVDYNFYYANEYAQLLSMSMYGGSYYVPTTPAGFLDLDADVGEGKTLRDYLNELVIADLQGEVFLMEYAQKRNLELDADVLQSIEDEISEAEQSAAGMDMTLDAYLQSYYGPEASVDTLRAVLQRYELINTAMSDYVENYQFAEGEDTLPVVYHVLFPTLDLSTYMDLSEEEQEVARQRAEDFKNSVKSLDDMKTKGDAAIEAGEAAEATQYTVTPGQMVEEFNDWCFSEHQEGDVDIVKTKFGYHVMFYVGSEPADEDQKKQLAYLKLQDEMDFAIQSGEYDPTYS